MLRTARALIEAKIPRADASTARSRACAAICPSRCRCRGCASARSAIASWCARRGQRQVDDGQYLLGLDVSVENGVLQVVEHRQQAGAAARRRDGQCMTQDMVVRAGARARSTAIRWRRSRASSARSMRIPATPPPGSTGDGCCTSRAQSEAAECLSARARAVRAGCPAAVQSRRAARGPRRAGRGARGLSDRDRRRIPSSPTATTISRGCTSHSGKPQHAIRHLGHYRRLLARQQPLSAKRARDYLGRHLRLQLSRVARQLLSRRSCRPRRCCRIYAERFARSRSTTPSTACRTSKISRAGAARRPSASGSH